MNHTTQWEYTILVLGSTFSQPKDEELQEKLNALGEEGWEVFSLSSLEGSNKVRIAAKRPLTAPARRKRSWPDNF